jgi:hypothetical protein
VDSFPTVANGYAGLLGERVKGDPTVAEQESVEFAIIRAAQHFVDGWLRSVHRRPFRDAVTHAAQDWVTKHGAPAAYRMAFIRSAQAIRVGRGHATAGPLPLIELVSTVLAEGS